MPLGTHADTAAPLLAPCPVAETPASARQEKKPEQAQSLSHDWMPAMQFVCTHAAHWTRPHPIRRTPPGSHRRSSSPRHRRSRPLRCSRPGWSPDGLEELLLLQPTARPPAAMAATAEIEINQRVTRMIVQFSDEGGQ